MNPSPAAKRSLLEHISTHWTIVEDPSTFVLRYAPAIREYIERLLRGTQDTEDVTQDFLMAVMTKGFSEKQVTRGRFRDFLRVAVRNAVIDHHRVKKPIATDQQILEESVASPNEDEWINSWRGCLLDKAWRSLRQFQKKHPGNLHHTILKLATEFPNDDSTRMAQRVSKVIERPMKPDAYRQQLHRAREKFAEIIVAEVRSTLRQTSQDELADELRELGLDKFVEGYFS